MTVFSKEKVSRMIAELERRDAEKEYQSVQRRNLEDIIENTKFHLEILAAAYVKATDIPIEECELVVMHHPNMTSTYRFRRFPKNEQS